MSEHLLMRLYLFRKQGERVRREEMSEVHLRKHEVCRKWQVAHYRAASLSQVFSLGVGDEGSDTGVDDSR